MSGIRVNVNVTYLVGREKKSEATVWGRKGAAGVRGKLQKYLFPGIFLIWVLAQDLEPRLNASFAFRLLDF